MPLHFRGRRGDIHPLGYRYRVNRIGHGRDVGPESESIVWAFVLGKRNDAAGRGDFPQEASGMVS